MHDLSKTKNSMLELMAGSLSILLLVFVVYFPAFRGGFIWDDDVLLTGNPLLKTNQGLWDIWFSTKAHDYFPLTFTSFWLEWRCWGLNAAGYHLSNILLHGCGAILLWRVSLRLRLPGAWLVAAIFAVHPVCAASVAWILERKNTLSLFFFFLSLLFYLRFDSGPRSRRYYWFSLGAFLLALLSKTSVVMLPFVLLGCALWQRRTISAQDILRSVPFFLMSVILGLITVWFQSHRVIGSMSSSDPLSVRLLGGSWAVWFYLYKTLLPSGLSLIYPRWAIDVASPWAYLPAVFLVALFFLAWCYRGSWGRALLFALGYVLLMVWPVLGFFDMYFLIYSRVADHWQYLAVPGGVALVVGSIVTLGRFHPKGVEGAQERVTILLHPPAVKCFAFGVIVFFSLMTWQRATVYAHPETLWRDTLEKNPQAWVAHIGIGNELAQKGQFDQSIVHLSEAVRIKPDHAMAHYNLANALSQKGDLVAAMIHYSEALKFDPKNPDIHRNLGIAFARASKWEEARGHFEKVVELNPADAGIHLDLGKVLEEQGRADEAIASYLKVPVGFAFVEAQLNATLLLAKQERYDEIVTHLSQAIRLLPGDPRLHNNLGNALAARKRFGEAKGQYEAALRLDPSSAETHNNLGYVLFLEDRFAEAVEQYRAALKISPDYVDARANLASALAKMERVTKTEP